MTGLPNPRRIAFGLPFLDEAEEEAVLRTMRSGWIGQGPRVLEFEQRLGAYTGAAETVAVSSCTAGLHLALVAAGVGPGDEVITTPFTFVATLNAIEHAGATPVCVDIDRDTLNITPEAARAVATERTRALMPVHFGGLPVDLDGFRALSDELGAWLVEDAAHAIGAVEGGRRVGGSGHARSLSCFSFYPNKNLASAEGGAIQLADGALAARLRELRLHGLRGDAWDRYRTDTYRPSLAVDAGFKYNWTDLQASIGLCQLEKLEGFLAVREHVADRYDELLGDLPGVRVRPRPRPSLATRHALHLYQVELEGPAGVRDRVLNRLLADGIGAAVHYIGVHRHPYYRGRLGDAFPVADWASEALLTLPLHLHLDEADLRRVRDALARALAAERAIARAA